MKNLVKKTVSIALVASLLLCSLVLVSCSDEGKLSMKDTYTIVTGKEIYLTESSAPNVLADGLKGEGVSTVIKNDSEAKEGDFEILVGNTNREESKKAFAKLESIDDFIVDAVSKNVIVICGKTPLATEKAVEYFLKEYVHAGKGDFKGELFVSGESLYKKEYEYESVMLEGIALKDYVISVKDDSFFSDAYDLVYLLGAYSGEYMEIINVEDLSEDNEGVVCLATNGRNPKKSWPSGLSGFFINKENDDLGVTVSVIWTNPKYKEEALETFRERFVLTAAENGVSGTFTPVTNHNHKDLDELNAAEWVVESSIQRPVADGVTQVSYTCRGYQNLPYLVHVMTVDLEKADLTLGTANNRNDVPDEWVHTPLMHAKAAESAGYKVLGATNGGGSVGMSIKEGVVMVPQGNLHRPFFALKNDGTPVIGKDEQAVLAKDYQMFTAGTYMIVDNYMPGNLAMDKEAGYTTHPRTLIGIRGDGKIVLVVIDGRQPELSNGAPLVRCADIMMKLGCRYALNLDGGGSSTMFVKKTDGNFEVVNKISDPTMRPVRNSILVVEKRK